VCSACQWVRVAFRVRMRTCVVYVPCVTCCLFCCFCQLGLYPSAGADAQSAVSPSTVEGLTAVARLLRDQHPEMVVTVVVHVNTCRSDEAAKRLSSVCFTFDSFADVVTVVAWWRLD
jgi:hypothetical protein